MFKEKFKNQKTVLGTWIQIPSPSICEIAASLKLDWLAVDMEHTEIGYETLIDMIRGLNGTGTAPFVRVRENSPLDIRRALDIGAQGVIVPLVHTAEEAEKAVSYSKYPERGCRGHAFCRANGWGLNFKEYAEMANKDTCVFVMIESRQAVENIDGILSTEGLDGIFIGPYDMSASYGVTGDVSHRLVTDGCNRVLEACIRHNKIAGIHIVNPDKMIIEENINKGFRFIAVGLDTLFLMTGIRNAVSIVRQAEAEQLNKSERLL